LYNTVLLLLSALASLSNVEARLDALHQEVNNGVTSQILSRLSALEQRLDSQQRDVNTDITQILSRLSALEAKVDSQKHDVDNDVTPLSGCQQPAGSSVTPIVKEFEHIHARLANLELNSNNHSSSDDRQALVYN
jgi:predicted  nucleic acid-binding Zn-ribbon protein